MKSILIVVPVYFYHITAKLKGVIILQFWSLLSLDSKLKIIRVYLTFHVISETVSYVWTYTSSFQEKRKSFVKRGYKYHINKEQYFSNEQRVKNSKGKKSYIRSSTRNVHFIFVQWVQRHKHWCIQWLIVSWCQQPIRRLRGSVLLPIGRDHDDVFEHCCDP